MDETIFENFLQYCTEDNPKLKKDIETWICDYFDLPNRDLSETPLSQEEINFININLSKENQIRILGYSL